ncbi:MAG: hypothetical protein LUG50_06840 [Planctomycetaceae bacterium]|nr:hypothetical protein [Planctomycetaceae bacterium]
MKRNFNPSEDNAQSLGRSGRSWKELHAAKWVYGPNEVTPEIVVNMQDRQDTLDAELLTKADAGHEHRAAEIFGLQQVVDETVDEAINEPLSALKTKIEGLQAVDEALNTSISNIQSQLTEKADGASLANVYGVLNSKAPLASPSFTGTPQAPTATAGTNNEQLATTAFVTTAVTNGTSGKANSVHSHSITDVSNLQAILNSKAPLADPSFSGIPIAPTPITSTKTKQLATTEFVHNLLEQKGESTSAVIIPQSSIYTIPSSGVYYIIVVSGGWGAYKQVANGQIWQGAHGGVASTFACLEKSSQIQFIIGAGGMANQKGLSDDAPYRPGTSSASCNVFSIEASGLPYGSQISPHDYLLSESPHMQLPGSYGIGGGPGVYVEGNPGCGVVIKY